MADKNLIQKVTDVCQNLLRIPSYSGQEGQLVEKLKELFIEFGFDEIIVDEYGSIIAKISGKRPGKKILMDAHMDIVPVSNPAQWKHQPFGGEIEEGCIYGRGASDMKGALSAMIVAADKYAHDMNKDFAGEIYIAGVVHEECFEGIASRRISSRVKPDYVIIGEASHLNLKIGQRGRAEIIVETFGKSAHSANPEDGLNAVYEMAELIHDIKCLPYLEHPQLGKGILELTDIISSPYPGASVVPDYCRATYDRRLLVGETKEEVLKPIQELISRKQKEIPGFLARAMYVEAEDKCYTGESIKAERFFPGWLIDREDEFVERVLSGLRSVDLNPEIKYYSFCTNGSHYAGEEGIKTVGFGPSKENLAHIIDEYIEINQLAAACKGYYGILQALLT